jgi:hypothetical protein
MAWYQPTLVPNSSISRSQALSASQIPDQTGGLDLLSKLATSGADVLSKQRAEEKANKEYDLKMLGSVLDVSKQGVEMERAKAQDARAERQMALQEAAETRAEQDRLDKKAQGVVDTRAILGDKEYISRVNALMPRDFASRSPEDQARITVELATLGTQGLSPTALNALMRKQEIADQRAHEEKLYNQRKQETKNEKLEEARQTIKALEAASGLGTGIKNKTDARISEAGAAQLGQELDKELAKLTPLQRELYDIQVKGFKEGKKMDAIKVEQEQWLRSKTPDSMKVSLLDQIMSPEDSIRRAAKEGPPGLFQQVGSLVGRTVLESPQEALERQAKEKEEAAKKKPDPLLTVAPSVALKNFQQTLDQISKNAAKNALPTETYDVIEELKTAPGTVTQEGSFKGMPVSKAILDPEYSKQYQKERILSSDEMEKKMNQVASTIPDDLARLKFLQQGMTMVAARRKQETDAAKEVIEDTRWITKQKIETANKKELEEFKAMLEQTYGSSEEKAAKLELIKARTEALKNKE